MKQRNPRRNARSLFDPALLRPAIGDAFRKLDPRLMISNPVMFVVEIVSVLTTIIYLRELLTGGEAGTVKFTFQIWLWLWIT
ncbi:MAG: potassium-transporting ATPase subunit B, partial [Methylocella sp.]